MRKNLYKERTQFERYILDLRDSYLDGDFYLDLPVWLIHEITEYYRLAGFITYWGYDITGFSINRQNVFMSFINEKPFHDIDPNLYNTSIYLRDSLSQMVYGLINDQDLCSSDYRLTKTGARYMNERYEKVFSQSINKLTPDYLWHSRIMSEKHFTFRPYKNANKYPNEKCSINSYIDFDPTIYKIVIKVNSPHGFKSELGLTKKGQAYYYNNHGEEVPSVKYQFKDWCDSIQFGLGVKLHYNPSECWKKIMLSACTLLLFSDNDYPLKTDASYSWEVKFINGNGVSYHIKGSEGESEERKRALIHLLIDIEDVAGISMGSVLF